jgi:hypothetical protein
MARDIRIGDVYRYPDGTRARVANVTRDVVRLFVESRSESIYAHPRDLARGKDPRGLKLSQAFR